MIKYIFVINMLVLSLTGCYEWVHQMPADLYHVNQQILFTKGIDVLMKDGGRYKLKVDRSANSFIHGEGEFKAHDTNEWIAFKGDVNMDSMDLVLVRKGNWGKSMVLNAAAITLLSVAAGSMSGPETPTSQQAVYNSSCPFIYSWTSDSCSLESEAFGTAIGKSLELETGAILTYAQPQKNCVRISIRNERPETHYINSVRMFKVVSDQSTDIVLDSGNKPWAIGTRHTAATAMDHSGRDVRELVASKDLDYWESDLANTDINSSLRDELYLSFSSISHHDKKIAVIIEAINTELITSVYTSVFGLLGDDALQYLHMIETDSATIHSIKRWIDKCALKIDVWNKDQWQFAGKLIPEANAVSFCRMLNLSIPDDEGNEIRLRLSSLPDVWKVDAVNLGLSDTSELTIEETPLVKTNGPRGSDAVNSIQAKDTDYVILFPNDELDLVYRTGESGTDKKTRYLVKVSGYLHEWIDIQEREGPYARMLQWFGEDRISALQYLMQHESLLLPPIYQDWQSRKH